MKPINFFKETREEMLKVSWPGKKALGSMTAAVIALSLGTALFLGILDFVFSQIVKSLIG